MSATYNRGKLKRLAIAGRLVAVDYYRFDDMDGASRGLGGRELPVIFGYPPAGEYRKEGFIYLDEHDLTGYGRAWLNADGTVVLYIHSNLNYTFKILPEPPKAAKAKKGAA